MAGMGGYYKLEESELRQAFESASKEGHEMMIHYTVMDLDLGASMINMMDCYGIYQRVRAFSLADKESKPYQDMVRHLAEYGVKNIIAIYDLSAPFEKAATGAAIATHPAIRQLQPEAEILAEQARLAARPWWKRILNLKP